MTISPSFKRHWPADRLARLRRLERGARYLGLSFKARNGGSRTVFLPFLTVWKGDELVASFWDLRKAEAWFHDTTIDRLDTADRKLMELKPRGGE